MDFEIILDIVDKKIVQGLLIQPLFLVDEAKHMSRAQTSVQTEIFIILLRHLEENYSGQYQIRLPGGDDFRPEEVVPETSTEERI